MGNAKILIVDDDLDFTVSLQAVLENQQYNVVTAANKIEGMEKVRIEKPDLVILDVMMDTTQEGFEMSRELRKDPEFKDLPILMLTSIDSKTGVKFKSAAGDKYTIPVDVYIDKPVEPHILLAEIRKLLSREP
jgi:two-component system alkaline phosphatase synthesis response regulator PhoP